MAAYISTCPSCRHTLEVTELSCPHCHIQIRGRFQGHPGLSLTEDQLSFLRLFVQSRGNLREIERVLGISYPTVRGKLDELVQAFEKSGGDNPWSAVKPPSDRRAILEDVSQGRVSLNDALDMLTQIKNAGAKEDSDA
jgi:hypothetical protein